MIIREVISLYKLNWKAHLWSLLIPLGIVLLSKIGTTESSVSGILPLMGVGVYWFNGVKFTLKEERKYGFDKTIAMLPLGKSSLLLSRIIYFYLNLYIYLGIIMPFITISSDSRLGRGEIIWLFTLLNLISIYEPIKYGKKSQGKRRGSKKNRNLILLYLGILFLGIFLSPVLKVILLIVFIFIAKEFFKELLNYYPINRELNEEERY